jgi:ABC-type antimicrobial peptide transport system permease subunit
MKTNLSADHHGLAVNFRELGNIRAFASYMAAVNEVQIDIAQIEAKENYSFITRLTKIISLILIGFSILSICLFLSNLLKNHLEKIKMNIGTFKAFGLDSKTLHRIYMRVIFSVILGAMSLSIIASWLFGKVGGMRFLLKIFGSDNLESGESYFELFDQWTLLSIVLILLISFLVLSVTARKILRKSPGDLIYDR